MENLHVILFRKKGLRGVVSFSTSSLAGITPPDDVQRAFSTEQVPQSLKTSLVSPVIKEGDAIRTTSTGFMAMPRTTGRRPNHLAAPALPI
ncbi:MAG: hypothetical protein FRX49_11175 [Trebouxia sp. A1-2]|nr:MAG: hypothetical protein FRX49_11175 [Trebouxia sp. A1-2]